MLTSLPALTSPLILVPPAALLEIEMLLLPLTLAEESTRMPLSPVFVIVRSPFEETVPVIFKPSAPSLVISVVVPLFETFFLMLKAPFLLIIFKVACLLVIVPSTIKFVPLLLKIASPVLSTVPLIFIAPFWLRNSALPVFVTLPLMFNPLVPWFSSLKPCALILPVLDIFKPLSPVFSIVNLPLVLVIEPLTFKPLSPLFVIFETPLLETDPLMSKVPFAFVISS